MVERTTLAGLFWWVAIVLICAALFEIFGWPASAIFLGLICTLTAIGLQMEGDDS